MKDLMQFIVNCSIIIISILLDFLFHLIGGINMSNFMHLTFEERCKIEELLNKRYRKYQIAEEIGKTQSTISR